jgi:sugar lactone lactonase YvrE
MSGRDLLVAASLAVLVACDGGDADEVVDGATADVGGDDGVDAGPDAAAPDGGSPGCGEEVLPVADITGTEGLAIAADGTLYYSQSGSIGRRRPGEAPQDAWVALPGTTTIYGLALRDDGVLFVAAPSGGGKIWRIDTTAATPAPEVIYSPAPSANGIVVGPDGAIYYSSLGGGHVYRLDPSVTPAARTQVTTTTIPGGPNGIFFADATTLIVLSYQNADVYEITLAQGAETARHIVGDTGAGTAPDGIARDTLGRWYIGDNGGDTLRRFAPDWSGGETLLMNVPAAANVVFGRGALACTDVYVASSGALGIFHADAP